jgi:hypothetical protein
MYTAPDKKAHTTIIEDGVDEKMMILECNILKTISYYY